MTCNRGVPGDHVISVPVFVCMCVRFVPGAAPESSVSLRYGTLHDTTPILHHLRGNLAVCREVYV